MGRLEERDADRPANSCRTIECGLVSRSEATIEGLRSLIVLQSEWLMGDKIPLRQDR